MAPATKRTTLLLVSAAIAVVQSTETKSAAAKRLPACSVEKFNGGPCQDLSDKPLDLRKTPAQSDGLRFNVFLVGKPGQYNVVRRLARTQREPERARRIAEEARTLAIETVAEGIPEESWSAEQRAQIVRLRTVHFDVADPLDAQARTHVCSAMQESGIPNAISETTIHTVTICPSLTHSPTAFIRSAIAHELGHITNRCATEQPLYEVVAADEEEVVSCLDGNPSTADLKSNSEHRQLVSALRDLRYYSGHMDRAEDLVRCHMLKPVKDASLDLTRDLTSVQRNFSRCLATLYTDDYENWITSETSARSGVSNEPIERKKSRIEAMKDLVPIQCFSKIDEHAADTFQGRVLAKWAKQSTPSKEALIDSLSMVASIACRSQIEGATVLKAHRYPTESNRLKLVTANKALQDMFGCEGQKRQLCVPEEWTKDSPTPGTASKTKTKTKGTAP